MINAELYRGKNGALCGFRVENHGDSIVCAAVSILCQNTVNSIEALTPAKMDCAYDEALGFIECFLPGVINGEGEPYAELLLNSFALGLVSVEEQYNMANGIKVTEKTIEQYKKR